VSLTILQLSDTHFTAAAEGVVHDLDPADRLASVLGAWSACGQQADLVVLTGDNADDGSLEGCHRLATALAPLGAPVFAVAGNHDAGAAVHAVFGSATHMDLGGWRVLGLASQRPGQTHGTLDVPAALSTIDDLDDRPTVIAIHHPPRCASTNPWFQLDGAAELLAALEERPHIRAVISGHIHQAFEDVGPGGVALLGCPSTLYALHHDGERYRSSESLDDVPTGARVLRLADDGTFTTELIVA
jgi:Icc protein